MVVVNLFLHALIHQCVSLGEIAILRLILIAFLHQCVDECFESVGCLNDLPRTKLTGDAHCRSLQQLLTS